MATVKFWTRSLKTHEMKADISEEDMKDLGLDRDSKGALRGIGDIDSRGMYRAKL
jgi:hypothetical protein